MITRKLVSIRDLSPKASATLARRALQGMIRDYWKVSKGRLIDEIDAIKEKVDPITWKAIDAIRRIGNIGAHMEKDINVIIADGVGGTVALFGDDDFRAAFKVGDVLLVPLLTGCPGASRGSTRDFVPGSLG